MRSYSSTLLLAVIALIGMGLVQVYSTSFVFATEQYGDGLFFVKRQAISSLIALVILFGVAALPFRVIEKWGWILWLVAAGAVLLTFVPGLGIRVGGATRWLAGPFGFRIEPAEVLKISFVLIVASLYSKQGKFLNGFPIWLLVPLLIIPPVLLLKQPDFGSFFIIVAVAGALLFSFGLKWRFILTGLGCAVPIFYYLVMAVPYRRSRVLAYLDPWSDPEHKGFQIIQSLLTFHSGGLTGTGLGQGQGKLFFLPEAHTDFTLAVLGEELGFIGFVILVLFYAYVVFRVLQLAVLAQAPFSKAIGTGFASLFGLSVFLNMAVVLGLLPTKGLTLPFLSYGGSSLVSFCLMFGILISLERDLIQNQWQVSKRNRKHDVKGGV